MSDELLVLKTICLSLNELGVAYMVTGSIAASFYSEPRMTRDIDIVIEIEKKDIPKLFEGLKNTFYIDEETIKSAIEHESLFNIIHNDTSIKVDLIIRKESEYRKVEFDRRRYEDVSGVSMGLVSAEDLILSKLLWGKDSASEMQMRDVKNILKAQKNLDHKYLGKWSTVLGIAELLKKASQT